MKKLFRLVLCLCLSSIVLLNVPVSAIDKNPPISVKINDNYILMDTEPLLIDNTLYVPLRAIVTALNAEIVWDGETHKITISEGENKIELSLDSNIAYVNGHQFELDIAPPLINNRTMVPIRFFAESMACTVNYNQKVYTVEISRDGIAVPAASIVDRGYTDEDLLLLAKIITVEVNYISFDAKIAVANVVINRKNDPQFPNTIEGVIYDNRYCVQFPPAHKSNFSKKEPKTDCIIAAKMAFEGVNNVDKCLYFNNRPFKSKSKDFYKKIDSEYFYY
ncbi:hypothetical protein SH1V18_20440 [Vallitalea longa]|uniref:Copper amine oxidase n=1 Tax=Vallitalea longa TaxID=2936439 RepID=A0A9W5YAJ5_9FIRM|nr:stalk domain-containing protein [Vallitalea longa]GKX29564.1 hypothetical protein SH1V18_20440 [Vallitalea longa]